MARVPPAGLTTDVSPRRGGEPPELLLRPWKESDASGLRRAIDEDVGHLRPWLGWTLEEPATLERTRERLRKWIDDFRTGAGFRYAVTPVEPASRILGGANLNRRVGPAAHDVGYWVRKSEARRGIASAAVSRLVVHAFEERSVERLLLRSDVGNRASAAFARSLGFQSRGEALLAYPDGTPRPVLGFELTRERYFEGLAPALRERAERVRLLGAPDDG